MLATFTLRLITIKVFIKLKKDGARQKEYMPDIQMFQKRIMEAQREGDQMLGKMLEKLIYCQIFSYANHDGTARFLQEKGIRI